MSNRRRTHQRRNRRPNRTNGSNRASTAAATPAGGPGTSLGVGELVTDDQPDGPHLVVALATTGQIHEQTLGSLQTMIRATRRAASVEMWWRNAYPGGHCRNLLVERFLADKSKTHLVFVDTDMVVPENGLDLLLETNQPLVCGPAPICRLRNGPLPSHVSPYDLTTNVMDIADPNLKGSPTNPADATVKYTWRSSAEVPNTPFNCDVTGMSFCLIARQVLERMTPPWFYFLDLPDRTTIGLDLYFFRKAGQLGYRVVVHPQAWCDHVKRTDLTRIEQLIGAPLPDPQWHPRPVSQSPRTMVIACTTWHWLDVKTAETLIRWQERPGHRIGVRLFEANDAAWALARWLHHPTADDPNWERILLLAPDIVPADDLLDKLASIEAPIVSPLTRAALDGRIAYTFTRPDQATGRPEHPTQLSPDDLAAPFEVHTADLACALLKRDTCRHTPEALAYAAARPDPARAFNERYCDLVRRDTGRNPIVAPVHTERRADLGLLGLLQLKHKLQHEQETEGRRPQPARL